MVVACSNYIDLLKLKFTDNIKVKHFESLLKQINKTRVLFVSFLQKTSANYILFCELPRHGMEGSRGSIKFRTLRNS